MCKLNIEADFVESAQASQFPSSAPFVIFGERLCQSRLGFVMVVDLSTKFTLLSFLIDDVQGSLIRAMGVLGVRQKPMQTTY